MSQPHVYGLRRNPYAPRILALGSVSRADGTFIYIQVLKVNMTTEQSNLSGSSDINIAACGYLIHGLLQRLDQQQPGLIAGMIEGISNDQESMKLLGTPEASKGVEIADAALRALRLMEAQLKM